jgi:DNA polymerase-3 subunit beta
LNKAFAQIGFSVSNDESRPILTGFVWRGDKGVAAATDGYRLSLSSNEVVWGTEKNNFESLIVPGKAMVQLLQAFSESGGESIRFGFSKESQELMFVGDDLKVVVRVLSGEFPKYEGILPGEPLIEFQANREQVLTAVKSVAIFARDSANIMKFSIDASKVEFSANAAQVGENVVEVEIETLRPGKGTIAFNSKYLVDFLSHSSSEKIGFGMTDSLKPGLFYEVGAESYKHVIMPVRVKG